MRPILLVAAIVLSTASAAGATAAGGTAASAAQASASPPVRVVDLTAPDGTPLKGSYFAAARPGPGVLLLHQVNRERRSWDGLATQLAASGIHTLTLDMRGHGASGGTPYEKLPRAQAAKEWSGRPADIEVAFQYLVARPGVTRDVIGLGGAGVLGVDNAVSLAKAHPAAVKSLVLLSGETFADGLQFLHQASQLPALSLIHYSRSHDAPWLCYEPFDIGRVPATGSHGTDLFETHAELPGLIVDWLVMTLIRTPGHAPADTLAAAPIIRELQTAGGAARVSELLRAARMRYASSWSDSEPYRSEIRRGAQKVLEKLDST